MNRNLMRKYSDLAKKIPPYRMPQHVNVDGEKRTGNLPKRTKIFKDYLKSLNYAPLEDEILELQFSMVSTSLAKRLDSLDKISKKLKDTSKI